MTSTRNNLHKKTNSQKVPSKTSYSQCSAQVFRRAECHLKRAHLARWTDRQKGTICAVNGRKRALLMRWTDNKMCVDNKKDKTAKKPCLNDINKAGRYFSFLKRAGRHQKGAGRRALQKRPRQNTAISARTGSEDDTWRWASCRRLSQRHLWDSSWEPSCRCSRAVPERSSSAVRRPVTM